MIWVIHPGSGSLLLTHPGSRIQGSKKHRIPDPQHCKNYKITHLFFGSSQAPPLFSGGPCRLSAGPGRLTAPPPTRPPPQWSAGRTLAHGWHPPETKGQSHSWGVVWIRSRNLHLTPGLRIADPVSHYFWKLDMITIRVNNWIRVRNKVKIQKLSRLKTWAVDAQNGALEGL